MATPSMSCPAGGQFYACATGSKFVGCCGVNPCGSTGCAAGNLAPASFDPAQYGDIPDQQCSAGFFYTCRDITPPFWGCCSSNPCSPQGCPESALAGAFLSNNPSDANPYLALNGTVDTSSAATISATTAPSTATTSPGSTLSTSTTATAADASASQPAVPSATETNINPSPSSVNVGAIAGGAVGGFAVLAIFVFGLVWLLRKRRNKHSNVESPMAPVDFQPTKESTRDMKSAAVAPAMYESHSPAVPPYPGSPRSPSSPGLPSYVDERGARPFSSELPGSPVGEELDGGQRYHAYRPMSGLGIDRGN